MALSIRYMSPGQPAYKANKLLRDGYMFVMSRAAPVALGSGAQEPGT